MLPLACHSIPWVSTLQEKLKSAITAATGYQPVAVSVSFDFADSKKTIETILEQDRNMCRFL